MNIKPKLIISDYWEAKYQGLIFGGVTIKNKKTNLSIVSRREADITNVYITSNGLNIALRWWSYQYPVLDSLFNNGKIVKRPNYKMYSGDSEHVLIYYSAIESRHKFIFDVNSDSFENMNLVYRGDETLCFNAKIEGFCIKLGKVG